MSVQSNVKAHSAVNNLKQAGTDAKDAVTSQATDYLTDAANQVGKKVGTYVDQAGDYIDQASGYFSEATSRIKTAGNQLEGQIEANPLRSSIIALSAGVILGLLLRK